MIECRDKIQWIIQGRRGVEWKGVSFHRNRDALIKRSSATGEALAILQALPEWHGEDIAPTPADDTTQYPCKRFT